MNRVAILTPSSGMMNAWCADSVLNAFADFRNKGGVAKKITVVGSNLASSRTKLVQQAKEWGATHCLWWDTDIRAPEDCISRMLDHDVDVVAANYPTKEPKPRPTAVQISTDGMNAGWLYTGASSSGLERASVAGFGLMMCKMSIFAQMMPPLFHFRPIAPDYEQIGGEDVHFCEKLYKARIPLFIDHDLSKEVFHVGEWYYSNEQACQAADVRSFGDRRPKKVA